MAIKITSALFTACITSKDALPQDNLPIIALVGRSNVGKSSLINALTNRRELARTSSLPGKTLTINFYNINEQFYIVDLPGYGYAKASKVTRQRIQAMMNEFFAECKNLKGVVQILDSRHKPSTLDVQMYDWLRDQKFNYLSVITKTDKLSNQMLSKMKKTILKELGQTFALQFSAKTLAGKEDFLDAVEKMLAGFQFKSGETRRPARKAPDKKASPESGKEKGTQRNPNQKRTSEKSQEKPNRAPRPAENADNKKNFSGENGKNQSRPDNPNRQNKTQDGSSRRRRRRPRKPANGNNENKTQKPDA